MTKISLTLLGLLLSTFGFSQLSQGDQVSSNLTQKLNDSLQLSSKELILIDSLNKHIQLQKMLQWKELKNRDELRIQLQKIESSRDSLYRLVLTDEKYWLYRQSKSNLINNQ